MATFWSTFQHDGKISPAWWGWGVHAQPPLIHYIYHHVQSCGISSSWEGRYTSPASTLLLYVLCGWNLANAACVPQKRSHNFNAYPALSMTCRTGSEKLMLSQKVLTSSPQIMFFICCDFTHGFLICVWIFRLNLEIQKCVNYRSMCGGFWGVSGRRGGGGGLTAGICRLLICLQISKQIQALALQVKEQAQIH
jgi:hypothetical protein